MTRLQLAQQRRELKLLDGRIDGQLSIALGHKNVSPSDRKKLKGLLQHYAKKRHPFTACVRDNTKRFGKDGAERVCATLKDVIRGTTKWRGTERRKHGNMAFDEMAQLLLSIPDDELTAIYADQVEATGIEERIKGVDLEDVELSLGEFFLDGSDDALELAEDSEKGVWKPVLRTGKWSTRPGPDGQVLKKPLIVKLAGEVGKGHVSLEKLKQAFDEQAVEHVTVPLSHQDKAVENTGFIRGLRIVEDDERPGEHRMDALIDFTDEEVEKKALNGSIANTSAGVLFDFVRKRDGKKYDMALGHVALTNKPWIDGMAPFGKLAASQDAGVDHVDLYAVHESQEPSTGGEQVDPEKQEGEGKKDEKPESTGSSGVGLADELGLSGEEVRERLERYDEMERRLHESDVDRTTEKWSRDGVPPAVIEEAKQVMLADDGGAALLLSQEGGEESKLTVSDVVERIVAKVPKLELEDASIAGGHERPKQDASDENVSHEVKVRATELTLADVNLSYEDALKRATRELKLDESDSGNDE